MFLAGQKLQDGDGMGKGLIEETQATEAETRGGQKKHKVAEAERCSLQHTVRRGIKSNSQAGDRQSTLETEPQGKREQKRGTDRGNTERGYPQAQRPLERTGRHDRVW